VQNGYLWVKKVKALVHSKRHVGYRNDILCAVCGNCIKRKVESLV
jgi:hypothetical protein